MQGCLRRETGTLETFRTAIPPVFSFNSLACCLARSPVGSLVLGDGVTAGWWEHSYTYLMLGNPVPNKCVLVGNRNLVLLHFIHDLKLPDDIEKVNNF